MNASNRAVKNRKNSGNVIQFQSDELQISPWQKLGGDNKNKTGAPALTKKGVTNNVLTGHKRATQKRKHTCEPRDAFFELKDGNSGVMAMNITSLITGEPCRK